MIASRASSAGGNSLRTFRRILIGVIFATALAGRGAEVVFNDGTSEWQAVVNNILEQYDSEQADDSLRSFLIDRGFLNAAVEKFSGDTDSLRVTFGRRYAIGAIAAKDGDNVRLWRVDRVIEQRLLAGVIDSILGDHRKRGYYYAEILVDSVSLKDSLVDFNLELFPGAVAVVSDIEFAGLWKTDPKHLKKYLDINRGDTLNPDRIGRAVQGLGRLDYLEPAGEPQIIPEPGYWGSRLVFPIREKKQFYFDGAAGYIPDDGGTFVGYINFIARNFLGRGRKAEFMVDRREQDNSTFMVSYRQPVFISGPGALNVRLKTRDYRDYFYEFALDADYYQPLSRSFDMTASLGWKNVEPADSGASSFQAWRGSLGINWGGVAAERAPKFQTELDWNLSYSRRIYRAENDGNLPSRKIFNDTRTEIAFGTQMKIRSGLSGYVLLTFKDIESSEDFLPLSEMLLIGGQESLRGYRPDQFSAKRLVGLAHEWRLFFTDIDYFYPFVDGVYFERSEADESGQPKLQSWNKWGYGLGISLSSNSGRLELSLGWSEEAAFDQPRLNVRLSGQF